MSKKISKGFTLTEVLITLSIIGVIVALTMPNLLATIGNGKTRTQLLKLQADMDQALSLYDVNGGSVQNVLNAGTGQSTAFRDMFTSVMRTQDSGTKGCYMKYANGTVVWNNTSLPYIKLKNGTELMQFYVSSTACTGWGATDCGNFYIDLDGQSQGANKYASDIYAFSLIKDPNNGGFSIVPFGSTTGHTYNPVTNTASRCNGAYGNGCAAEILGGLTY
jgi:prepilin-type N-terminal cleavage/methylation domain-containing protein